MSERVIYSCVLLDNKSQKELKKVLKNFINTFYNNHIEQLNYENDIDVKCHHMTIKLGELKKPEQISKMITKTLIKLKVTHIGYSEKAIAIKVVTPTFTKNKIPHVTLCSILKNNGKPFDSNKITKWQEIPKFEVNGFITEIKNNG